MAKASVIIALAMLGLCAAQTAIGTHDVPPAPRDDYATCQPSPHALDNVLYLEEFDRFVTRTPIDCDERSDGGCPEPDYMLGLPPVPYWNLNDEHGSGVEEANHRNFRVECVHECEDLARNGDESDVDCGGGECAWCADGRRCDSNSDCGSNDCAAGVCMPHIVIPPP